ncbi:hydrogenase maturation protease [Betaproteobacteria bacterium SCN2]|jgi:hydrogenase maturation protease|nr:hydrogenase maturation protease [Betaproteobacteria bacterium SCN2]
MNAHIHPSVRILCIGSPTEPDNLGFLVAHALMGRFDPEKIEVVALDRPGPRLIEHMRGADTVILVDAVKGGAAAGTLHKLEGRSLDGLIMHHTSSHGFGLAETLALADRMGELPKHLKFVGLEAGTSPFSSEQTMQVVDAVTEIASAALRSLEQALET